MHFLRACSKVNKMNCWGSFYMHILQQHDLLIDEQEVNEPNPIHSLGSITRQVTQPRYPLRLSTRQTSTLTTSTRGKSVIQYIQYVHDKIAIYTITSIFIAECIQCMQPQIHTACTRYYSFEQILLSLNSDKIIV